ncbi:MAG: hypothetical protein KDB53_02165 [Planctomycetes bacterium]|nr:hypothetical protein [Planctomycetota bacterium]
MQRNLGVLLALVLVCLAIPATAQVVVTNSSPYFEDFESGPGAWSTPGALWQLGTPAQTGLNAAFSGVNAWMTNLTGNYSVFQQEFVEASFDFSGLTGDPLLAFQLRHNTEDFWDGVQVQVDTGSGFQTLGSVADANWYNDSDVDGIANLADGWSGDNLGYQRFVHTLDGTAGQALVIIRFFFGSDSTIVDEGVAIDDVAIFAAATVTNAVPYSEDFESGPGVWTTGGTLWELGTPAQAQLSGAFSGTNAWMTDLDTNYPDFSDDSVGVTVNALGLTNDPVFSFRINYAAEMGWDGATVEIDTGTGFVSLGAMGDGLNWYNDVSSASSKDTWSGSSGGYVQAAIVIPGVAGTVFDLRVRFESDNINNDEGVAFDDVFIGLPPPTYPGTGEDLALSGAVNAGAPVADTGIFDVIPVLADDFVFLNLSSPGGTHLAGNYSLLATPYDHQMGLVPEAIFPGALVMTFPGLGDANLYVSMNTVQALGSAAGNTSLNIPVLLPPGGVNVAFQFPMGLVGNDFLFQGIVSGPNANNFFYVATSGIVIDS